MSRIFSNTRAVSAFQYDNDWPDLLRIPGAIPVSRPCEDPRGPKEIRCWSCWSQKPPNDHRTRLTMNQCASIRVRMGQILMGVKQRLTCRLVICLFCSSSFPDTVTSVSELPWYSGPVTNGRRSHTLSPSPSSLQYAPTNALPFGVKQASRLHLSDKMARPVIAL